MKKLIGISLLCAVGLFCGSDAEAAGLRGGKAIANSNFTTVVSSIATNGPVIVHSVLLSTGTAGTDYVALFDVATCATIAGNGNTSLKMRVNVSSATQNTLVQFNPPLQFLAGACFANSAAANWSAVTYERGRLSDN